MNFTERWIRSKEFYEKMKKKKRKPGDQLHILEQTVQKSRSKHKLENASKDILTYLINSPHKQSPDRFNWSQNINAKTKEQTLKALNKYAENKPFVFQPKINIPQKLNSQRQPLHSDRRSFHSERNSSTSTKKSKLEQLKLVLEQNAKKCYQSLCENPTNTPRKIDSSKSIADILKEQQSRRNSQKKKDFTVSMTVAVKVADEISNQQYERTYLISARDPNPRPSISQNKQQTNTKSRIANEAYGNIQNLQFKEENISEKKQKQQTPLLPRQNPSLKSNENSSIKTSKNQLKSQSAVQQKNPSIKSQDSRSNKKSEQINQSLNIPQASSISNPKTSISASFGLPVNTQNSGETQIIQKSPSGISAQQNQTIERDQIFRSKKQTSQIGSSINKSDNREKSIQSNPVPVIHSHRSIQPKKDIPSIKISPPPNQKPAQRPKNSYDDDELQQIDLAPMQPKPSKIIKPPQLQLQLSNTKKIQINDQTKSVNKPTSIIKKNDSELNPKPKPAEKQKVLAVQIQTYIDHIFRYEDMINSLGQYPRKTKNFYNQTQFNWLVSAYQIYRKFAFERNKLKGSLFTKKNNFNLPNLDIPDQALPQCLKDKDIQQLKDDLLEQQGRVRSQLQKVYQKALTVEKSIPKPNQQDPHTQVNKVLSQEYRYICQRLKAKQSAIYQKRKIYLMELMFLIQYFSGNFIKDYQQESEIKDSKSYLSKYTKKVQQLLS